MAEPPILSWEGLGLQQGGGWLFRDLDLHVGPRDRLALIGRNGVGKTTLLKMIADRIDADRGERKIKPGTRIVMLEQDPFFTGFETLMDFALAGSDAPARHEVEAIAGQLGIDMARPAESASGGERRRASLARALAMEPDLLLLDEPVAGMNLEETADMARFILDIQRELGITMVMVEHDMGLVMDIADRVMVLDFGEQIALGKPAEVQKDPNVVAAYEAQQQRRTTAVEETVP